MELNLEEKEIGKAVLNRIADEEAKEQREELRVHLAKGKWFIKGAEAIIEKNPVYYDRSGAWQIWNPITRSWEEHDETDVLVMVKKTLDLLGDTSVRHSARLLEALRQVSRQREPKDLPLEYIQFGPDLYNIKTGESITSTPEFFSTNAIPWKKGQSTDTPEMDKLIISWVGEKYLQTIYELIAYCAYRDYPIHRIFCFVGTGANGKTRLLKIIEKFVGNNNKASATLKKLGGNDFALYPIYRKLVCFIGETAHHRLESTEIIKALSGQDPVSFEAKGRNSFTATNYAKLIIGTNVLPPSSDTSRGWYRRWFVIRFPNEFQEGEDVLNRISEYEYENLVAKVIDILPGLLQRGSFSTEGTIEERQAQYMENSNPLKTFLNERYERDPNSKEKYSEVYLDYLGFLAERKLRRVSKKDFSSTLEDESLEVQKTSIRDEQTRETVSFNVIWGIKKKPIQRSILDIPCIPDTLLGSKTTIKELETDRGVGNTAPTKNTITKNERLKAWFDRQPLRPVPIDEVAKVWDEWEHLKEIGELYEPKPGFLEVL